ncbi:hypothetical protein G7046_g1907 [Stylonectria norvegica]|nr:hypothetical protein G7046_g1907 [Stylonectria norvegica]
MAMPRESFLPTIKCSSCSRQVEISMMGEHICPGPAPELSPPLDGGYEGYSSYSQPPPEKQGRTPPPPSLNTVAANGPYMRQGQLTPNSIASERQSLSPSPLTPNFQHVPSRTDDYFAPQRTTEDNSTPSPRLESRLVGGYGGFGEQNGTDMERRSVLSESPGNISLLQRMNTIAPGPFDTTRRPSVPKNLAPLRSASFGRPDELMLSAPQAMETQHNDRPGTATSVASTGSNGNMAAPRLPFKSGYEGFGPPALEPQPLGIMNRSETFPRPSFPTEAPLRTPSAPGPRPDIRKTKTGPDELHARKPSMGPVTTRPPPPRKSLMRPTTAKFAGSVDLAAEFGASNPYHTPSDSGSSGYSTFSHPSQTSSQTSPARSQPRRQPSDPTNIDDLMEDLEKSMDSLQPNDLRIDAAAQPPSRTRSPLAETPHELSPRKERRDPAHQLGRPIEPAPRRYDQPTLSPQYGTSPRDQPALSPQLASSPRDQPALSPQFATSPRDHPNQMSQHGTSPRDHPALSPYGTSPRDQSALSPLSPQYGTSPRQQNSFDPAIHGLRQTDTQSRLPPPIRKGSRDPAPRGDCKACKLPIKGKSISSADGRLTGKYHKACFVCATCSEPFTSAEFYVLDDKPYCEQHYHKLNGSLCGSCGTGIEGQYLEDEFVIKYHVGCFRCLDCGRSLSEGYFEVDGKSYCERDAWRRVQQSAPAKNAADSSQAPPRSSHGHGPGPRPPKGVNGLPGRPAQRPNGPGMGFPRPPYGLPTGNRLAAPSMGPPRPRMNKRNTRLGMM